MSNKKKGDYDVGYKKPPIEYQFKPGQSGNPKGRPKKENDLESVLDRTLEQKIVVNEHGKKREVTKLEAAVAQQVNKAVMGDIRAFKEVSRMYETLKAKEIGENGRVPLPWDDDD